MTSWSDFAGAEPDFAARVRAILDAHTVKGADLRRDPRFALHSVPADDDMAVGDVKVAGRAIATGPLTGEQPGDAFHAELTEVVWTGLNAARDRLVVESWHPGRGRRRVERE